MAYNVEKLSTIDLGRQGENLARTVEIDVHPLLEQWPDAVISLLCKRKHDTNPYIAVTEVRDGILIWPITSVETETAGDGKIELRAVCGEVIAKSMTAVIRVTASLTGSETEAPDAAQGWVDQVLAAGSSVEANAMAAQDAAARAESAAADIDAAVDNAEAAAKAAEEQASMAGYHASAAGLSATEAEGDAQRAEQAAISAEESAASALDSASEAELSREGADASVQAALAEYNKAAEKAEAAQVSAATAEQSASDAKKSKTAAEQSASAAKSSETNAAKSAEAAAKSASDAAASKDAAAGSAAAAKSSEENAAKSAEDAAASTVAAEKSREGIEEALASAAESAKAAGQSAENSEASAARSEAAAQVALTIIDDENVGTEKTWSSQNLLDRLTVPFEKKGAIVQCYPVEDSPLSVVATIEPVQHFDWASKSVTSTQVTTMGKNLFDVEKALTAQCKTDATVKTAYVADGNGIATDVTNYSGRHFVLLELAVGNYCLSAVVGGVNSVSDQFIFSIRDFTTSTDILGNAITDKGYVQNTFGIEQTSMIGFCFQARSNDTGATIFAHDIQLEIGDAATDYEPYTGGKPSPSPEYPQEIVDSIPAGSYYVPSTASEGGYWKITLDEALGGVKDYMDVIEVDSFTGRWRIIRNSARVELNTDTVFLKQGVGDNAYFVTTLAPEATEAYQLSSFCSHFPVINLLGGNTLQGNGGWKTSLYIRWGERFDTADELNAYVAEQFNAGTPITVRYARAVAEIATGQAEHVTSTTGLTELEVVSVELEEPDPDHPCEITVAQTVQTARCGKNLISNDKRVASANRCDLGTTLLTAEITYTLSVNDSFGSTRVGIYAISVNGGKGKRIGTLENGHGTFVSNLTGAYTIHLYTSAGLESDKLEYWQLELGSKATDYESYNGDIYKTDLPEEFAGGKVNVTGGKVRGEWTEFVLDGTEKWNINSNYNYVLFATSAPYRSASLEREHICNQYCSHYSSWAVMPDKYMLIVSGGTYLGMRNDDYTTIDEWKSYLATQYAAGTPVIICYKITQPTENLIPPTPISALEDINTITTDADSMTVSGYSDPIRIIANLTERVAALEDAAAGGTT